MSPRPAVLIVAFSDLKRDPRVARQIRWLSDRYAVTALGTGDPEIEGVTFVPVARRSPRPPDKLALAARLKTRRFANVHERIYDFEPADAILAGQRFDLILANDVETLPFVLPRRRGAKILLDAHEFAPREFDDRFAWRLLFRNYAAWMCERFLPEVDGMTTVCAGIAEEYARSYPVRPQVLTNAPDPCALEPTPLEPGRIRILHHGLAIPSRQLERTIELAAQLDTRFRLDLMLIAPSARGAAGPRYLEKLRRLARAQPNVRLIPPVEPDQIVPVSHRYDMGLFLLPPVNYNYLHALPNKFFEFVQARLAVAIGPSPEMAPYVERHALGVVAADFAPGSLARALNGLTADEVATFKQNSHRAAPELSSTPNRRLLEELVARLLADG